MAVLERPVEQVGCLDGLDDAGRLDHLLAVVRRLGTDPLSGAVDDEALTASVAVLHRAETMVAAEKLRRLGEVDARKAYLGKAVSAADWAASRLGLTRGEAKTQAATAAALQQLPATAAKLADGRIGVGQAAVAARALNELQHAQQTADAADAADADDADDADDAAEADRCDPAQEAAAAQAADTARQQLDALVADHAGEDRGQLRRRVDDWQARNHQQILADRERRAFARRHAWLGTDPRDGDGMLRLEARLDAVSGATVRAALEPLARPSNADGSRTSGQRLADALVALAEMALNNGNLPQTAVARPHVLLITTPDTLHHTGTDNPADSPTGGPSHPHTGDPAQTHTGEPAHPDSAGRSPTPTGDPSLLDGIGPVSPDTARQVCCDADVTPIVVDRNGAVLDVGRSRRDPTPAQRKAVIARDRTCVGCGAPANRCQIHHIRWWRHHGRTDLNNLTLLCWACHHNVHHNNWTVTRNPDGHYTAQPPDPPDRPHPRHTP